MVYAIIQNKIRMIYQVSRTAVCYVTVITLFIKKVGVVHPIFFGGGPDPPFPPRPSMVAPVRVGQHYPIPLSGLLHHCDPMNSLGRRT